MAKFRNLTVTTTSTNIKTSGADVSKINIVNRHSAAIFVKFYDQTVATFQDTPVQVLQVAANANLTLMTNENVMNIFGTGLGLCVRVTTGVNDNDATAAATLPIIEVEYK